MSDIDFSVLGEDFDYNNIASPTAEPEAISPLAEPRNPVPEPDVDFSVLGDDFDFGDIKPPEELPDMVPVPVNEVGIQLTESNRQWENNKKLQSLLEMVAAEPDRRVGVTKLQQLTGVPFDKVDAKYDELKRITELSIDPEKFRREQPYLYHTVIQNPYLADTVIRKTQLQGVMKFLHTLFSPENFSAVALMGPGAVRVPGDIKGAQMAREKIAQVQEKATREEPIKFEEQQLGIMAGDEGAWGLGLGKYAEALSKGMLGTGFAAVKNVLSEMQVPLAHGATPTGSVFIAMQYGQQMNEVADAIDQHNKAVGPAKDLATLGNKVQSIDAEVYALERDLKKESVTGAERAEKEARLNELLDKKFSIDRDISYLQRETAPVTWGEGPMESLLLESMGAVTSQTTSLAGMGAGAGVGAGIGFFIPVPGATAFGAKIGALISGFMTTYMMERGTSWLDMRTATDDDGNPIDLEEAAAWNNVAAAGKALLETGMDAFVLARTLGPAGDFFVKSGERAATRTLLASRRPGAALVDITKRYITGAVGEGLEEGAQQGVDILARIGAGAKAPTVTEAFDQILHAGLIGAIGGGVVAGAGTTFHVASQMIAWHKVRRAGALAAGVAELSTIDGVREAPAEFAQMLTIMAKDMGRPIEGIFLSPLRLQEVVEEKGGNLSAIVEKLLGPDGMKVFEEARNRANLAPDGATRATLRVDTEVFLREWAGLDIMQGFGGDVTTASDTLTLREQVQQQQKERAHLRETMEAIRAADEAAGGYVPQTEVEINLHAAVERSFEEATKDIEGFKEDREEKINAIMVNRRAMARVMSERTKYTTEEILQHFTLQFQKSSPAMDAAAVEQQIINMQATIANIEKSPEGREEQLDAARAELRTLEARKAAAEVAETARITSELLDPAEIARGVVSDEAVTLVERVTDALTNLEGPTTESEVVGASREQVREQAHNLAQWETRVRSYMANNGYTDQQIDQHIANNRTLMAITYSLAENPELEFLADSLPHTQRDAIQQAWSPEFLAIYDANGRDIARTRAAIAALPMTEAQQLVKSQIDKLKAEKKALPRGKAGKQTEVVQRKAQIDAKLKPLEKEFKSLDETKAQAALLGFVTDIEKELGTPWPKELDAIHKEARGDVPSMLALINDVADKALRSQMMAAMKESLETGSEKNLFKTQTDKKTGEVTPVKAQPTGAIRGNSDAIYRLSFDLSAMCRRRLEAAATVAYVEKRLGEKLKAQGLPERALNSTELLALANLFRLSGKAAPCLICYVEAPRASVGEKINTALAVTFGEQAMGETWKEGTRALAQAAIDEAQEMGLKLNEMPSMSYWTDLEAAQNEELRAAWTKTPRIYDYLKAAVLNTKQNTPKAYAEYWGQILNMPQEFFDEMEKYAGFRFFSTSDFQFEHVIDLVQAFHDLALRKATSHAYTKVSEFVEIFGRTGQKIQTSLFTMVPAIIVERDGKFDVELRGADGETTGQVLHTAGTQKEAMEFLDEYTPEGGFLPDEWQGMEWSKAMKYREEMPNVGNVLVTTSRAQIRWGLDNDQIDYMIPFHASGMKGEHFKQFGYVNFTSTQDEKWLDPEAHKGEKVAKIRMHELGAKDGISNAEMTRRYLKLCRERGLLPAFSEFAYKANVEKQTKGELKDKWVVSGLDGEQLFVGETQTEAWDYLGTRDDLVVDGFAKLKKDYARSDTPFRPVRWTNDDGNPTIDMKKVDKVLRKFFDFSKQPESQPDYPSYTPDPAMADQLMRLIIDHEQGGPDPLTAVTATVNATPTSPRQRLQVLEEELGEVVAGPVRYQDSAATTKVVDNLGRPKTVYASAEPGGFGTEFNTDGEGAPVTLNIYNPVRLNVGSGGWNVSNVLRQLFDYNAELLGLLPEEVERFDSRNQQVLLRDGTDILSEDAAPAAPADAPLLEWRERSRTAELRDTETTRQLRPAEKQFALLKQWLDEHGVDGVVFTNPKTGVDNYIPVRESQVVGEQLAGPVRFQESLRDKAAAAMPDTKVVDEDGKPKVVYHGTSSDSFTVFDREFVTKMLGRRGPDTVGSWFTTDRDAAEMYGENVLELYLNITNPKRMTWEEFTKEVRGTDTTAGKKTQTSDLDPSGFRFFLKREGYDGVVIPASEEVDGFSQDIYIALEPEQVKSATGNVGTFDKTNPDIRYQGSKGARGFMLPIRRGMHKTLKIFLRENADVSTPLHEMAHTYLTMLHEIVDPPPPTIQMREVRGKQVYEIVDGFTGKALATFDKADEADTFMEQYGAGLRGEVPKQVQHDFNLILNFMGASRWDMVTEAMEEKYARAFEKYMLEGNAPSVSLITTFARISSWMFKIYRGGKDLDAEIDDTIRGVFDRMLATDDEIALMRKSMGIDLPLYSSARAAGMTPSQFAKYNEKRMGQVERAALHARRLTLAAQKDAMSKEWRKEFDKQKAIAEENYDRRADVRAAQLVRRGKLVFDDGEEYTGSIQANGKLDRSAVRALVGVGSKTELSLRRATVVEGGIHPDDVATMFGYTTGKEVLEAIAKVPPRSKTVREEADAMTEAQFPEMKKALEDLDEKVGKALHMEGTTEALLREWRMINTKAGRGSTQQLAIEQHAHNLVLGMGISNLRPADALAKELRFAEMSIAEAAKGDFNKAADYKMHQLINHFIYRELVVVKEARTKAARELRDLAKDKARKRLGKAGSTKEDPRSPYLDVIDNIVEGLGFANRRETARPRMSPSQLADRIAADGGTVGYDPETIERFIQRPKKYEQLTVSEFIDVYAAVKNIVANARKRNRVKYNEQLIEKEEAVSMLLEEADENMPTLGDLPSTNAAESVVDWILHQHRTFSAWSLRQSTMLNWLGGKDATSAWHQLILRPLREAEKTKAKLVRDVAKPIVDAFENIPGEVRARLNDRIDGKALFPGHNAGIIKAPTRRFELLIMALNIGTQGHKNEQGVSDGTGNFERLLAGRNITEQQVMSALSQLTLAEWQWVQSVWDASAKLWPIARDLEMRDSGVEPGQLPLRPVTIQTSDGHTFESPGGYVPIVYDRRNTGHEASSLNLDVGDMMDATHTRPGTSRGYLKSRVKNFAEVVSLEPGLFKKGIMQVSHDVAFREPIRQAAGLILNPEVQQKLKEKLGDERTKTFVDWLRHVGSNGVQSIQPVPPLLSRLRSNSMAAIMGHRVKTAMGDIANGFAALPKLGRRFWLEGYSQYFLQGQSKRAEWQALAEKYSTWLTTAKNTLDTDFANLTNKMFRGTSIHSRAWNAYKDSAWWAFEQTFKLTAYPMWVGSVQKHMAEGMDIEAAAYAADDFCMKYFPSHTSTEKSSLQRDRGLIGFSMIFFGYMNSVYQINADAAQEIHKVWMDNDKFGQKVWNTSKALPAVAGHLLAFWFASMVLGELFAFKGPPPEEDDLAGWAEWVAIKETMGLFGPIPFAGRIVETSLSGKPQSGARGTPGVDIFADLARMFTNKKLLEGDPLEITKALRIIAAARGIPAAPLDQVDYVINGLDRDLRQGDVAGIVGGLLGGRRSDRAQSNIVHTFSNKK